MSKREKVLNWFVTTNLPHGISSFDDLATVAARETLGLDHIRADKYSFKYINSLWTNFCQQQNKEKKNGLYPVAYIIDKSTRRIESTPSRLNRASTKKMKRLSARLSMRPFIHCKIEGMNDRVYEALCCLICNKIGATRVHLTPKGDEGGIDFLALVEGSRGFQKCFGLKNIRIVGQAKKHNHRVQVGSIRDFNDTLGDVRRHSPSVRKHIPKWFKESNSPIIGWMVGHSGFQSGCEVKARMSGIVLLNSRALAEAVVLCRETGATESGDVVAQAMVASCYEILKKADIYNG